MDKNQLTPQQAWDKLAAFWSPFSFMLVDGATSKQIELFESKEDVVLQSRVKELISIYSAVGIPTGIYGSLCAENSLSTLENWIRFDNSSLNTVIDNPDFWPGVFKDSNCPSLSMKDYVVIGSDPWGADYGVYIMLHQASNTVFCIVENIPEIIPLGDIVTWLAEQRLGNVENVETYVNEWNNNSDEPGGVGIANTNRFYLGLGYPDALARWNTKEKAFIVAFDNIGAK